MSSFCLHLLSPSMCVYLPVLQANIILMLDLVKCHRTSGFIDVLQPSWVHPCYGYVSLTLWFFSAFEQTWSARFKHGELLWYLLSCLESPGCWIMFESQLSWITLYICSAVKDGACPSLIKMSSGKSGKSSTQEKKKRKQLIG